MGFTATLHVLPSAEHLKTAGGRSHQDEQQQGDGGDDNVQQQHTCRDTPDHLSIRSRAQIRSKVAGVLT